MRGGVNGLARVEEMAVEFPCIWPRRCARVEGATLTVVVVCAGTTRGIVGGDGRVVLVEMLMAARWQGWPGNALHHIYCK